MRPLMSRLAALEGVAGGETGSHAGILEGGLVHGEQRLHEGPVIEAKVLKVNAFVWVEVREVQVAKLVGPVVEVSADMLRSKFY